MRHKRSIVEQRGPATTCCSRNHRVTDHHVQSLCCLTSTPMVTYTRKCHIDIGALADMVTILSRSINYAQHVEKRRDNTCCTCFVVCLCVCLLRAPNVQRESRHGQIISRRRVTRSLPLRSVRSVGVVGRLTASNYEYIFA